MTLKYRREVGYESVLGGESPGTWKSPDRPRTGTGRVHLPSQFSRSGPVVRRTNDRVRYSPVCYPEKK